MSVELQVIYLEQNDAVLTSINTPTPTNNITGTTANLSTISDGMKIVFFEDTWKDSIKLVEKNSYSGLIFDTISSATNECDVTITLNGSNIKHFSLYFDDVANEYATKIEVNGVIYNNNNWIFTHTGIDNASVVVVKLKQWNKANRPIRLNAVILGLEVKYKPQSLAIVDVGSATPKTLTYGISTSSGSVVLQDSNDKLLQLYTNNILKDGLTIKTMFNQNLISTMTSDNVNYSLENSQVTFDLVAKIMSELQNKNFIGYALPETQSQVQTKTAYVILYEIYNATFTIDDDTKYHLQHTTMTYPIIESTTVYKALNLLMNATQCLMTITKNGELIIKYVG